MESIKQAAQGPKNQTFWNPWDPKESGVLLGSMIEDSIKWIQDIIDKDPVIGKNLTLVKEVEMLTALTAKLRFHLNNNIY